MTDSISQQLRNHRCHSELTRLGKMTFSVIKEEGIEPHEDYSRRQVELNIVRLENRLWRSCLEKSFLSPLSVCMTVSSFFSH